MLRLMLFLGLFLLLSTIPFLFNFFKKPLRVSAFYVYIGVLSTVVPLLDNIYFFTAGDLIQVSAGNTAYAALLMTLVLIIIIEKDFAIIKNLMALVAIVNLLSFVLFKLILLSLANSTDIDPSIASSGLFNFTFKFLLINTLVLIGEMFILLLLCQPMRKLTKNIFFTAFFYSLFFIGVITLGGGLFAAIAFAGEAGFINHVLSGLASRLAPGLMFSVPYFLFIVLNEKMSLPYLINPVPLDKLIMPSRDLMIQELEKQRDELFKQEELFKVISTTLPDMVFCKDKDLRLTFVNHAVIMLFNKPEEEIVGKCSEDIFDKDVAAVIKQLDYSTLAGNCVNETGTTYIQGRKKILHTIQAPIKDITGEVMGICGITRDITDLRLAEERMDDLNRQLLAKNKEMEQIIYATSHDLKSPLINIVGFSEELFRALKKIEHLLDSDDIKEEIKEKAGCIISDEVHQCLNYISINISRMNRLLTNLSEYTRVGRANIFIEQIDMNHLLESILRSYEYTIKDKHVIIQKAPLPPCMGDAVRINQVFSNLIDNALKYLKPDTQGIITIKAKQVDNYCVYSIEDNGIGIKKDYHEKIFDIFFQLNPQKSKGEGIGLAIVKRIIQDLLNGDITLESEQGQGTCFYVKLPGL